MIHVIQIKIKKLYLSIVFLFPKHGTVLTPIIFAPDSPSCGLNMWLISVVQATFPHLCPATVHQPATPGRHPSRWYTQVLNNCLFPTVEQNPSPPLFPFRAMQLLFFVAAAAIS